MDYKPITDKDIDEFIEIDQARLLDEYTRDYDKTKAPSEVRTFTDKEKKWLTFTYCLCYFSLGLAVGVLGPTVVPLSVEVGVDTTKFSWVFGSRGIGWIVGSAVAGPMYERFRGNRIMWMVLVIVGGLMATIPVARNFWVLVVVYGLMGSVMSWVEVGVNTLTLWLWKDKVGPYMQLLHFAFGFGLGAAPFTIALVEHIFPSGKESGFPSMGERMLDSVGRRLNIEPELAQLMVSHWVMAALILITALFPLRLPSPPIVLDAPSHEIGAQLIKQSEQKIDESTGPASTAVSPLKRQRVRFWLIVSMATAFIFLYGGAENVCGGWMSTYANVYYNMSDAQSAYVTSAFWIALTIGRIVAVPFSTKISSRSLLLISLTGCTISVGAATAWETLKIKGLLWACVILLGFSMSAIFASAFSIPAELKVRLNGRAASFFIIASGVGDMTLPILVGWFMDPKILGPNGLWYSLIVVFFFCILFFVGMVVYGLSTMEKRIDEEDLASLSELDNHWEFRFETVQPSLSDSSSGTEPETIIEPPSPPPKVEPLVTLDSESAS
eukprot:TRINITY_DN1672_c0_g1_i2.p1 TRINITY_DN1672_c0_g1~~TRINITY_DN1672_c0_g1_i2.p1  ORF type:complete len:553 (-),score=92.88 TRINITY_DN1672_c0_g1_i2:23-1681(-)